MFLQHASSLADALDEMGCYIHVRDATLPMGRVKGRVDGWFALLFFVCFYTMLYLIDISPPKKYHELFDV